MQLFFKLLSYFLLRMSLAMYAAPFDNDIDVVNNKDNDNLIGRKRVANNRTQKRMPKDNNYSEKVNSVLQTIHNLPDPDQDINELGDFNPIPPPTSMGVEQTRSRERVSVESNNNHINDNNQKGLYVIPPSENNNTQDTNSEFYERFIPDYGSMYNNVPDSTPPYYNHNSNSNSNNNSNNNNYSNTRQQQKFPFSSSQDKNDILIEKLNYMINLLEEQQDEKTNNVMEEVVLYSFLGIFIIFIVDSFARVGKYVR